MLTMCRLRERSSRLERLGDVAFARRLLAAENVESHHRDPPQLEALIEDRYGPTTPVLADLDALVRALPGPESRDELQECFLFDDGRLWITLAMDTAFRAVRPGDYFVGGMVFTGDLEAGTWEACCRPVRLVCTNGQVLPVNDRLGTPAWSRKPDGTQAGSLEQVVQAAFAGRVLAATTALVERITRLPAEHPQMAMVMLGMRALDHPLPGAVWRRAQREEPTAYGVLNAITAVARESQNLAERYRLERLAGVMIAQAAGLPTMADSRMSQPV